MLNKRTNILFDQQLWDVLSTCSQKEGKSIGALVRFAIVKTYVEKSICNQRQEAIAAILANRVKQTKINYQALINYGRKI